MMDIFMNLRKLYKKIIYCIFNYNIMNYTYKSNNLGTTCSKTGIKIHESGNDYRNNDYRNNDYINNDYRNTDYRNINSHNNYSQTVSFIHNKSHVNKPIDFYNTSLNDLDLDLEHYSLEDLYNLFNIRNEELNEENLKEAKRIVLKMHPDKSKLDQKYFLFFSNAYKRLYSVYEFQNKSSNKKQNKEDYYDEGNQNILNNMFETNKTLKEPKNFNNWFNTQFEKHRLENPNETGYGDWLKSNEGVYDGTENVSKSNMNSVFEKKKKEVQSMIIYNGVNDIISSTFGGSALNETGSNFGGGNIFSNGGLGYTDLKQAHVESVIPVTEEDYERMPKYKNINDYKTQRDRIDTTPLTKEESERILIRNQQNMDKESAALAYKYAVQAEKAKEKNKTFWGEIKQLTGW